MHTFNLNRDMENYMYSGGLILKCNKCNNKNVKRWIDGVCSGCRKEPPTTNQLLSLSFRKLNSMNSQITFYTVLIVIQLILILLWVFGVIDL